MMNIKAAHNSAISEKSLQLRWLIRGEISKKELANIIAERRVSWIRANLQKLQQRYSSLPIEEQAYRIIFFEHMNINPVFSGMSRLSASKIEIRSYNFCPYLEACKNLQLDTREICREVDELGIQEMIRYIHPKLVFLRDYNHIRPHKIFCREFIELTE